MPGHEAGRQQAGNNGKEKEQAATSRCHGVQAYSPTVMRRF
jgi:hypothetical protein